MGDPNLLRILVSTDNHLGVWERDEERKHDSFNSFEEVLQLAHAHNVDMLLLGGDLFHDNKPSRTTIIRTIQLLNTYCLGDRPVRFQVLNRDQREVFVNGCVNYLNPHLNIGLPLFTIHGNHDDPSGQDNTSAVDLLSSTGLLNYFGKVLLAGNSIGKIQLTPVLIQKGGTHVALYGLGNVRDERLGRLFQTPGCVQWVRPLSSPTIDQEDWLNVFVLHQNRVQHGPTAKNCLQERQLPGFLDLVVWGHEHECIGALQDLQQADASSDRQVQVLQPGSSVATALSEGESKPKQVTLLEMSGDKWRTIQLPLATVRPFVFDSVVLAAAQPPLDPEDAEAITAHLERKVNAMIQQANRSAAAGGSGGSSRAATQQQQQQQQQQQAQARMLPLIRLRVDYTGLSTVNSQRFGQKYVNKVANPHDMLLWTKAPARRAREAGAGAGGSAAGVGYEEEGVAGALGLSTLRPEQLDQARIEDLVAANLQAKLDILHPDEMAAALHQFVEKDEKTALSECVTTVLQETQVEALSRPGGHASLATANTTAAAAAGGGGAAAGDNARDVHATPSAAPLKDEDIAEVINLSVQRRVATKREGGGSGGASRRGGGSQSAAAGAAAAGGPFGLSSAGPGCVPAHEEDECDADLMDEDGADGATQQQRRRGTAAGPGDGRAGARGSKAAAGGMPPPAPKGRQRKGAPAAAGSSGGFRQAGLAEAFARGGAAASQGGGAGGAGGLASPQGKTGSNLNGYLTAGGDGGGTPSQATSSRSAAAAAAAAAKGGRGSSRAARKQPAASGARGVRKRSAAAAAVGDEEVLSSDEEAAAAEGISDDDGDDCALGAGRPAKRARGAPASQRPKRSAAAKRAISYTGDRGAGGGGANDDDDEDDAGEDFVLSDKEEKEEDDNVTQPQQQRRGRGGSGGRSRRGGSASAAAAAAASSGRRTESISELSASLAESIEDSDAEDDSHGRRGRGAGTGRRGGGGSQRRGAAPGSKGRSTQQTTQPQPQFGAPHGPQSLDGGYVSSDDEGRAPGPGSAAPSAGTTATAGGARAGGGGGRRRVLPSSLA